MVSHRISPHLAGDVSRKRIHRLSPSRREQKEGACKEGAHGARNDATSGRLAEVPGCVINGLPLAQDASIAITPPPDSATAGGVDNAIAQRSQQRAGGADSNSCRYKGIVGRLGPFSPRARGDNGEARAGGAPSFFC